MGIVVAFDQRLRKKPLIPIETPMSAKGVAVLNKSSLIKAMSEAVVIRAQLEVSAPHQYMEVGADITQAVALLEEHEVPLIGKPVRVQLWRFAFQKTATVVELRHLLARNSRRPSSVDELVGFVNKSEMALRHDHTVVAALGSELCDQYNHPYAACYAYEKATKKGSIFTLFCGRVRPEWLLLTTAYTTTNAA